MASSGLFFSMLELSAFTDFFKELSFTSTPSKSPTPSSTYTSKALSGVDAASVVVSDSDVSEAPK